MKANKLHIVAFDVPYPPDYGGAIDIYYKVKSLFEAGAEIHLHCFEYGRCSQEILKRFCSEVHYYPRRTGVSGISFSMPYIVASRNAPELLANLIKTDASILFEGIHTTCYINHPALASRFKAVRVHNVEHEYYRQLADKEPSLLRKLYFRTESALLDRYEHRLSAAQAFFALSKADSQYFTQLYPTALSQFIPPFHSENHVMSKTGTGTFCLYQGNLAHPENIDAVRFLLREVAPHSALPLVIAGRNPTLLIRKLCTAAPGCELVENPTEEQMEELVMNAHIHLLPTMQRSGVKLKLIKALFSGRHVIANDNMVHGTGLTGVCTMANSAVEFINEVRELHTVPFTQKDIDTRIHNLVAYSNAANATLLLKNMM